MSDQEKLARIRDAVLLAFCDGADYSMVEGALEEIKELLGVTEAEVEQFQQEMGSEA